MQGHVPVATRGVIGFTRDVFRSITWRALLLTQALGITLTVFRWLEQFDRRAPHYTYLAIYLIGESVTALLVMLSGLAGDQAVRRGWPVWRALVLTLSGAALIAALVMSALRQAVGLADPRPQGELILTVSNFLDICSFWGMAMMVFLNNRSASRMLEGMRATELERVQVERQLLASRLAVAETHVDPASILRQLAQIRDTYASARAGADEKLEGLIANLRRSVAQSTSAMVPGESPP
ncbi:MAG TPA: hypothetical protein VN750_23305 [Steroidobacteraceae bacterium]|nr:hypothetical protein [Steroidobacteraceae bacterium]